MATLHEYIYTFFFCLDGGGLNLHNFSRKCVLHKQKISPGTSHREVELLVSPYNYIPVQFYRISSYRVMKKKQKKKTQIPFNITGNVHLTCVFIGDVRGLSEIGRRMCRKQAEGRVSRRDRLEELEKRKGMMRKLCRRETCAGQKRGETDKNEPLMCCAPSITDGGARVAVTAVALRAFTGFLNEFRPNGQRTFCSPDSHSRTPDCSR